MFAKRLATALSPISVKYKLDELKLPPIPLPGAILEVKMAGDIVFMSKKAYPAHYVTQKRELEVQFVSEANHALNTLVSDTRFVYDDQKKTLTYRAMIVTKSTTPNVPAVAVGGVIDSQSPVPKLRFEFRFPKLSGSIGTCRYNAIGFAVVVELTPKPDPQRRDLANASRAPALIQRQEPARSPVQHPAHAGPSSGINSSFLIKAAGVTVIVAAGALVIGTLVEDFLTVGAGVADDPASFALAAAGLARGLQMIRGAAALLPAASVGAAVTLKVSVESSRGPVH